MLAIRMAYGAGEAAASQPAGAIAFSGQPSDWERAEQEMSAEASTKLGDRM